MLVSPPVINLSTHDYSPSELRVAGRITGPQLQQGRTPSITHIASWSRSISKIACRRASRLALSHRSAFVTRTPHRSAVPMRRYLLIGNSVPDLHIRTLRRSPCIGGASGGGHRPDRRSLRKPAPRPETDHYMPCRAWGEAWLATKDRWEYARCYGHPCDWMLCAIEATTG
jgi:hypothetical protein